MASAPANGNGRAHVGEGTMKFETRGQSDEDQLASVAAKSAEAEHDDDGATTADDQASGAQGHVEQEEDASAPWDDPDWSILDGRRGELPEFPTDVFSGLCQHWLERAAQGAGVTPAHVAVPLLAVASGLVGSGRRVRATQSWSPPMSLWTAVVGFSGSGKTPGIDVSKNALSLIEKQRTGKIADRKHGHEGRRAVAKAALKVWREEVQSAIKDGRVPPAMPLDAEVPAPFVAPQLYVTNATIGRLAVLLQTMPRGMLYITDELSALFDNMGRSSRGRDEPFWLEAWNGGHYVVERMNRAAVVVEHLLIGLVGGFQPDALARSFARDQNGMYSRFLFAWPTEPTYRPLIDTVAEVQPDIISALTRLVDLPAEENGTLLQTFVPLSSAALEAFEDFRLGNFAARGSIDGRELEYLAKGPAQVLRLSGTLAYLAWAFTGGSEPEKIEAEFVKSAVRLWDHYFWPHARAALRLICVGDRHVDDRRVLRWIRASGLREVSLKDVRRDALSQRLDAKQTQALLDSLVKLGWLREVAIEKGTGPGRPARRWVVNPCLRSGADNA